MIPRDRFVGWGSAWSGSINETLGPIETKFGLTIYKVTNISPAKQMEYEKIREDLKKKLTKLTSNFLQKKTARKMKNIKNNFVLISFLAVYLVQ